MTGACAGNVVAVVQARMGSLRMPGKVLMDIAGKPMLWHVVERLSRCRLLDKTVVATGSGRGDDLLEAFCQKNGYELFRGSEENVLDRYYHASKAYKADVVVRIAADRPLLDPGVVDGVIEAYLWNRKDCDAASNTVRKTFPVGLDAEVFPFSVLEAAWRGADKGYQREHVTPYIYDHPEMFRVFHVMNGTDLSGLRWTVDEEHDLIFVREVYKRLNREGAPFSTDDVLELLKNEPHLSEINSGVRQRTPQ